MKVEKQDAQFERIKVKLGQARRKDAEFAEFGASSHQYKLKKKLTAGKLADWEARYGIKLPEPFAGFLTEIGNGGAGPYYGIYSLAQATSYTELPALQGRAALYPGMTPEEWNLLTEPLTGERDISDEEYEEARNKALGGMLCIGTQGCDYEMYLVLEGEHRGRIVYTSEFYPDHPFFFVYEDNFLDWYERWLDEIILDYHNPWFGSRLPGDENTLIQLYRTTPDGKLQVKALEAMFKFKRIAPSTLEFLNNVAEQSPRDSKTAISLLCKTSFAAGRPYLLKLLQSDDAEGALHALTILNTHGKNQDRTEFIPLIRQRLEHVDDEETLRYAGYILKDCDAVSFSDFAPFLCHASLDMQTAAVYAVRDCRNKQENWEIIEQMFRSGGTEVVRSTITYWDVIPHEKLLPYYKAIWPEYKGNPNFREKFAACLRELHLPDDYFG
ncbi:SMI1/KNR4 family protein [Paenibacillus sp. FSL R7-0179]|uniref:SMI1/KNR4 family protein n=1 Tax=Paenibacillus sp. FSL R7-0179 TaxID=2921672 RepID=UPI0030F9FAC1